MPHVTSGGTKFAISSTAVLDLAGDTLAELEALTYTDVGGIMSISPFGDTTNQVTYSTLGDARVRKLPGAADGGVATLEIAWEKTDEEDFIALRAAFDSRNQHAFQVKFPDSYISEDPTEVYFLGQILSAPWNVNNNDSVFSTTINVSINSKPWEKITPPA